MESVIVFWCLVIIGAFLFAVFGVVVLLGRTSKQKEELEGLRARIASLEQGLDRLPAEKGQAGAEAGEVPALEAAPEMAGVPEAPGPVEEAAAVPDAAALEAAPETAALEAVLPEPPSLASGASAEPAPRAGKDHALGAFIRGGNLWAAGGVLLLLAGFAALMVYLVSRGFFTLEMGIAAAALAGLGMIVSGWRFRRKRPGYFLILQGGGMGILYLSVFAAHKLSLWFSPAAALVMMSILIPPALVLAFSQNSQPLAVFAFLGGFAAPILLSSGGGGHVFLFSYYLILDLGVLALVFAGGKSRRNFWPCLKALAFFCTFTVSVVWAATQYEPEFFLGSEPFFIAYILIFTVLGLAGIPPAGTGEAEARGISYSRLLLLLGTPFGGALLQWKIFAATPHGYALISVIFSLYYILAAFLALKRGRKELRLIAEAYLALGAMLANLALPLELAPDITSAVWAVEGALVVFWGLRRGDRRVILGGLVLHGASAIAFFFSGLGFFSRFTGSLLIALSAFVMVILAGLTGKRRAFPETAPAEAAGDKAGEWGWLPGAGVVWGFCWWFGGWFFGCKNFFPGSAEAVEASFFILSSLSALAAWGIARFLGSPFFRLGFLPPPVLGLFFFIRPLAEGTVSVFGGGDIRPFMFFSYNFFAGPRLWGWLGFFLLQGLLFFMEKKQTLEEKPGAFPWFSARLFAVILILLGVLGVTGRYHTRELGLSESWTSLAGLFPLFAAMIILSVFPLFRKSSLLISVVLPRLLSAVLGLWFIVTLFLPGNPDPLGFYIPLLNPLDLLEGFCIAVFLFYELKAALPARPPWAGRIPRSALFVLADCAVFLWLLGIIARATHYYGSVRYSRILWSGKFHLAFFIVTVLYGILHIIGGNRSKQRQIWIAGAVLTVLDIAKLLIFDLAGIGAGPRIASFFIAGLALLFIGWAAPLPPGVNPPAEGEAETGGGVAGVVTGAEGSPPPPPQGG